MGHLDFSVVGSTWEYVFGTGMVMTLAITVFAAVVGLLLGILLAVMRLSPWRAVSFVAASYVNGMRSLPLLLIIFWFYFLVPYLGAWVVGADYPLKVGAFRSALVSFTLFEAAYFCEIIRAGIQSIPRGQVSAGLAIGLTNAQVMREIVLPQAIRNMIPSLLARTLILFQDTSLVYVVSLTDFLGAATKVGQRDGRLTEMYLFVAAVYFIICFVASKLVKRLEARIKVVR